ncbi:hypothetical protein M8C21_015223, partial [Ambrosia artemisiifolia]
MGMVVSVVVAEDQNIVAFSQGKLGSYLQDFSLPAYKISACLLFTSAILLFQFSLQQYWIQSACAGGLRHWLGYSLVVYLAISILWRYMEKSGLKETANSFHCEAKLYMLHVMGKPME